jgi:hypothetical protein
MAPVLFLFLVSAFAETLEAEWKQAGIEVCTVRSFVGPSLTSGKGKLQGHLPKEYLARDLTVVEILQYLYVDDGAFIFKTRADMTRGLALLHRHFGQLGLEMHISRGDYPPKQNVSSFPLLASLTPTCSPYLLQATMRLIMQLVITTTHSLTKNAKLKTRSGLAAHAKKYYTTNSKKHNP